MNRPAYCNPRAHEVFQQELPGLESPRGLIRVATAISLHECPEYDVDATLDAIDSLANIVSGRLRTRSFEPLLAHLHDVLFDVVGLRGNDEDYYNSHNSYLPDVLKTGKGIPISLSLVYFGVADTLGLRVVGLNAPGHFLLRVSPGELSPEASPPSMVIDSFYGGLMLTEDEARIRVEQATGRPIDLLQGVNPLAEATHSDWIERMLRNLQATFTQQGQERSALAMQELQTFVTNSAGR